MVHYIHIDRKGEPDEHLEWRTDAVRAINQAKDMIAQGGKIIRVKVSDEDGRVIWSEERNA